MMKLYIMRHGQAESLPNSKGQRPLSPVGVAELEALARALEPKSLQISHVMHSEKRRAEETAKIMAKAIAKDQSMACSPLLNPDKDIDDLLIDIEAWHDDTLLVGHMPCVSQLVSQLVTGGQFIDVVRFAPGTLVCLERYDQSQWIVNWVLRPCLV